MEKTEVPGDDTAKNINQPDPSAADRLIQEESKEADGGIER